MQKACLSVFSIYSLILTSVIIKSFKFMLFLKPFGKEKFSVDLRCSNFIGS